MRLPLVLVLTAGLLQAAPNFADRMDRPLRYHPEGPDFVIENGGEFFNRPLYGGNTAFRVDGGDKPEFVLYLPGRGGNLRLGLHAAAGTKWLHNAADIVTRYRPGELRYEIRDPLLGPDGVLRLVVLAYEETEGILVQAEGENVAAGLELFWAYGGVNGQRGRRDGDIGTESVPISRWFQLQPGFCAGNSFSLGPEGFTLRARPATIVGVMPAGARLTLADAARWNDPAALLIAAPGPWPQPVVVGRAPLTAGQPLLLSLQRIATATPVAAELDTYLEVKSETASTSPPPARLSLPPAYPAAELPRRFAETERYFTALRTRVTVDTPDAFLNAAVGSLNIAADAVWDGPQQAIMHGAIAWRTKLLGWRGPYLLDALGWHDRARRHFTDWAARQNTSPIPARLPPADENANLARNETGLHSNGDLSNSHYDMNQVFIDALFRHLRWTGDLKFAKEVWPVIERHLAWERRLFRREFDGLPLYEAYATIWASDDLAYGGGGAMQASADNYFHNTEAARLARLIGADPAPYEREAQLLGRSMREHLWLADRGWFGEYKDLLGLQRVHPDAALWTFYHALDSNVPTPREAWQMARQVDTEIPHLPVRGPGVPAGLVTLGTSDWMPYTWSLNNVVMGEAMHAALGFWQMGRPDEAWRITKGSLLAAMFMGISPGNIGTMSYFDAYRGESQRDFADGAGVLARALVEGLFGVRPDALAGRLLLEPGWPAEWEHAILRHPDFSVAFRRTDHTDTYVVEQKSARPLALQLRLVARGDRVAAVTVDGAAQSWRVVEESIGRPRIDVPASAASRHEVVVRWAGDPPRPASAPGRKFFQVRQGQMSWWQMAVEPEPEPAPPPAGPVRGPFETVDLTAAFNDRVTRIFKNEYRSPRSPFVSLALPKQGIGAWAGGVNATAEIDDTGLRALAAKGGGRFVLPDGVPFATPGGAGERNIVFTSRWDNYPREAVVRLSGRARRLSLLMAGSTNPMQSRFDNGEVIVTYADGTTARLALENPTNWWPIEQDYLIDDYQFRRPEPLPVRVDLKTGRIRVLEHATFDGRGGIVPGGAATVLELPLQPDKDLASVTVRALANDVVIGLMAATLHR